MKGYYKHSNTKESMEKLVKNLTPATLRAMKRMAAKNFRKPTLPPGKSRKARKKRSGSNSFKRKVNNTIKS